VTSIGELFEVNPKDGPIEGFPTSLIAMADVDAKTAIAHPRVVEQSAELGSARRVVRQGDVLFARISPSMENGKVAIVPPMQTAVAVTSGELLTFRAKSGVDPRSLWAFLRWNPLRNELAQRMMGSSGQQRLSADSVTSLELPGDRQDLSLGLQALERLDRAGALKRQSDALVERLVPAMAYEVAGSAPRRTLESLGVDIAYGTSARSSKRGPVAVLRIPNVVERWVDLRDLRYLPRQPGMTRATLRRGDLLTVRTNGSLDRLGHTAVYEGKPDSAVCASYLLRLRCPNEVDPDFLWAWFQTAEARSAFKSMARSTAGQYNLNSSNLRQMQVPSDPDLHREVGQLARRLRRSATIGRRQSSLLERTIQAHLGGLFGARQAREGDVAQPVSLLGSLPTGLLAGASDYQRSVWNAVGARDSAFSVRDVAERGAVVQAEQALTVLEQLGFLVREDSDGDELWRAPQLDVDLIS
jgi:hypothetical protein